MKQWAALLGAELQAWPGVGRRPMFGFDAYYRQGRIFALLPRTRALETPCAIAYKSRPGKAGREESGPGGPGWKNFELESGRDLGRALARLEQAWRQAGKRG